MQKIIVLSGGDEELQSQALVWDCYRNIQYVLDGNTDPPLQNIIWLLALTIMSGLKDPRLRGDKLNNYTSVIFVISGGQFMRIGRPTQPMPRETYMFDLPIL